MGRLKAREGRRESQFNHDWVGDDKQRMIHHEEHLWASEKYGLYMLSLGTVVRESGDLPNMLG